MEAIRTALEGKVKELSAAKSNEINFKNDKIRSQKGKLCKGEKFKEKLRMKNKATLKKEKFKRQLILNLVGVVKVGSSGILLMQL